MNEFQAPQAPIARPAATGRIPISAYILAVISGVFVTVGSMIAVAFSHLFFGDWITRAPRIAVLAIPYLAIGLGILSAWQSLRQAKRKAVAKAKTL
ncbi:hypothetical protein P12x_005015 [Tundrisphaera lichenicola]|uniref:hypothetical protein n=1 Tax=Tundrisphaera lichenicola TaxID=2029860 RepID=UPI003EB989DC